MQHGAHPGSDACEQASDALASIDIAPLLDPVADPADVMFVAGDIDRACRELGFFRVTGYGLDPESFARLDRLAREFFERPDGDKERFAMRHAGSAWRGWFPLRGEITSGIADRKEGLYVGIDHTPDDPRVLAGTPLFGANLLPGDGLGAAVDEWLANLRIVADAVMRGIALGLRAQRGNHC